MVFVQKSLKADMPKDAIPLTRKQALIYQIENIDTVDKTVSWPLKYGRLFVGCIVGIQAGYIVTRLRQKMRLQNYGHFAMVIPFAMGPGVLASIYQWQFVSQPIILQNECSICVMTRSVLVNTILSSLVPAFGGGVSALWYGHNIGTYTLPAREWKNLPKFCNQILALNKSLVPIYYAFLALNIICSSASVTLQEKVMEDINKILAERDLELAEKIFMQEKRRRKYTV